MLGRHQVAVMLWSAFTNRHMKRELPCHSEAVLSSSMYNVWSRIAVIFPDGWPGVDGAAL